MTVGGEISHGGAVDVRGLRHVLLGVQHRAKVRPVIALIRRATDAAERVGCGKIRREDEVRIG